MKGLGDKTLQTLKALYNAKGYLILDDISYAFNIYGRADTLRALNILIQEGYLSKIDNTEMPIKFNFQDPYQVEEIDMLQVC